MKKIKFYLLLFWLNVLIINCFSQNNLSLEWMKNSIGDDWEVISDHVLDRDGNIYFIN